ncbi:MAG: LamB/YcsF family protein [Deltaproteobacteria bacterium]|nr:LamB/YcsF family protein [Deltaproteobacteria bacterium]
MLLNVDGGELSSEPEELYALADVVNVACGGHAGDDASMDRVARACARVGTRIGAHPSYDDREGFGRRARTVEPSALAATIEAQCRRLIAIAGAAGIELVSVKPHGALYHAVHASDAEARACVEAIVRAFGARAAVAVVGLEGGALHRAALAAGLTYQREAFADRGVRSNGSLVPRGEPGALIEDPAEAATRAKAIAASGDVDTVCIHGDTEGAVAIARAVRAVLGPKP